MRRLSLILAALLLLGAASPVAAYWPVHSKYSRVSQFFHRSHPAVDIAAPKGAHIYPMHGGVVVFAGWKRNCGGWQVWMRNGNGHYSVYAHMLYRPRVRTGQWVSTRTRLGYVGRSGTPDPRWPSMVCATGYHVHVELWHGFPWHRGSYRLNPWNRSWLRQGYWYTHRIYYRYGR